MHMECMPPFAVESASCPACDNHHLQTSTAPNHTIEQLGLKGAGVVHDDEDAPAGTFYGEYCGELIDHKELAKRQLGLAPDSPTYFLHLETTGMKAKPTKRARERSDRADSRPKLYIDSRHYGNTTRYLNHSCTPNATYRRWTVGGTPRIAIYTIAPIITRGSEVTINYYAQAQDPPSTLTICRCGASNCSGVMGKPKTTRPTPPLRHTPPDNHCMTPLSRRVEWPNFHDTTLPHIINYTHESHLAYMELHPDTSTLTPEVAAACGPQRGLTAHISGDIINPFFNMYAHKYRLYTMAHPYPYVPSTPPILLLTTHFWAHYSEHFLYREVASWTRRTPTE